MIIMPERLQELMDELKITSSETYYHSIHVKSFVYKMIKLTNKSETTDYTDKEIETICKGALLHDIGKIYIKNVVLTKPSGLTSDERECMINHTKLSFEAVEASLTEFEHDIIKNICLYHHERCDGSGYNGICDLPMYVQIVSLCDVFDALTTTRVYREALDADEAISMIEDGQCGPFPKEILRFLPYIVEQ